MTEVWDNTQTHTPQQISKEEQLGYLIIGTFFLNSHTSKFNEVANFHQHKWRLKHYIKGSLMNGSLTFGEGFSFSKLMFVPTAFGCARINKGIIYLSTSMHSFVNQVTKRNNYHSSWKRNRQSASQKRSRQLQQSAVSNKGFYKWLFWKYMYNIFASF